MNDPPDLSAAERATIIAIAYRMLDLVTEEPPPKWRRWETVCHEDALAYGPVYSPCDWFAGGEGMTDADMTRMRRAVGRLEAQGLIDVTDFGRRCRHLRLTPKAVPVLATLAGLSSDDRQALAEIIGEGDDDGEA